MKHYFWAEVDAKTAKSIYDLVRNFFKDFNPESCIKVEGKHAEIKVAFDEQHLPTEIIEALTACEDENLRINYNQVPNSMSEQGDVVYIREAISKLKEIAANSISYEEFKLNINNKWLELQGKKLLLFLQTLEAAEVCEKINWRTIEEYLSKKGIDCSINKRTIVSKGLCKKNIHCGHLELIKLIVEYKTYDFNKPPIGAAPDTEVKPKPIGATPNAEVKLKPIGTAPDTEVKPTSIGTAGCLKIK